MKNIALGFLAGVGVYILLGVWIALIMKGLKTEQPRPPKRNTSSPPGRASFPTRPPGPGVPYDGGSPMQCPNCARLEAERDAALKSRRDLTCRILAALTDAMGGSSVVVPGEPSQDAEGDNEVGDPSPALDVPKGRV